MICAALLIAAILLAFISGVGISFAAATRYSGVLEDLQKDEKFYIDDYPEKSNDYSLKIIQIAESADGELFIYVYQPAANTRPLAATDISMALSEKLSNEDTSYTVTGNEFSGEGFGGWAGGGHGGGGAGGRARSYAATISASVEDIETYSLHPISRKGVFAKYSVSGFSVLDYGKRYYNISTIYRKFNDDIDDESDNDNTINKVAIKVGQLWTATTTAEGVQYEAKDIEVVKLTSQMIGMHRYSDGFQFDGTKSCDSHYIAFTCDHKIDKLLSADVEFDTRSYKALAGSKTTYGELVHHRVTLYDYQVASNDGSGWFGKKEDWHRMSSVRQFIKEVDLSDNEKKTLSSYNWILNFYESKYKNEAGGKDVLISGLLPLGFIWTIINACTTTGELVFDVSLLRLEFKYDGDVYNLGVVSNIQTGSNKPTNGRFNFWVWLSDKIGVPVWAAKLIISAIIIFAVLGVIMPILSAFFPVVGLALKGIFKVLWLIISAPFRFIAFIVKKISKRKESAPAKASPTKSNTKSKRAKTKKKRR